MDRLTQSLKIDEGATCAFLDCIPSTNIRRACDECLIRSVANRLSEYEDTGLTPKEVGHICITLRNNGYKHINHQVDKPKTKKMSILALAESNRQYRRYQHMKNDYQS